MRLTLLAVLMLLAIESPAEVLPEDDNGPFTGVFGLPGIDEGGAIVDAGRFRTGLAVLTASHAIVEDAGTESLIIDGETIRTLVDIRYGIRPGLELGVELPYVVHQSGGLDSLIDTWHDIFGLPEGSRDDRPSDLLDFSYGDSAGGVLSFTQRSNGVGDIRVYGGLDLASSETHKRALRLSIKLPTGDADELLGSGGTDVSVGIACDIVNAGDNAALSLFYRANLTYLGEPELLADIYKDFVGQASAGFSYAFNPRFSLGAQSTLRTAMYESDIEALGESALTLTFGGTIGLSDRLALGLSVTEDIKVSSAPDVTFNIGFRYRP